VLNAANEAAVDLFLRERIAFARIPAILEEVLGRASIVPLDSLETAVEADQWARQAAVEAAASSRA
jgi:1-deoxy-D-xylulose-5-phosphate reductoisomerase